MKELSIEEKAKAYDKAIERAKQHCADYVIETIFPELAESEDEKIRKAIIEHYRGMHSATFPLRGLSREEYMAWLEKQGEQKPTELPKGEDYGIDSLWHAQRILEKTLGKVEGYQSDDGILEHKCAIEAVNRLYEQKPADKVEPKKEDTSELTPFEAELFSMMSDAWQGYQLGEEVNIAEIVKEHSSELLERANKQNSAWSEEDETGLGNALWAIKQARTIAKDENDMGNLWYAERWLNSLRNKVIPQPKQEWSEEDIVAIDCAVEVLSKDLPSLAASIERLKSLRPQSHWKPSDEQMKALEHAINCYSGISPTNTEEVYTLEIMKEQLKKLKA